MGRKVRFAVVCLGPLALCAMLAAAAHRLWLRELIIHTAPKPPVWTMEDGRAVVKPTGEVLLAEVGEFDDELMAYMHFEYMKTLPLAHPHEVLLTVKEVDDKPLYRMFLAPESSDLLGSTAYLAELAAEHFIPGFDLKSYPRAVLMNKEQQTRMFEAAYRLPVSRKLESLGGPQLISLTQRFILFKSRTDPRIRKRLVPEPALLSQEEARELAADILAVAEFYELPLDFFLGIGAMENNYMNVPGDLDHAVWKRRAQEGDIVLRRRRGRVLVLNYATGPWQITRETLRYAHKLYLKDERDYGQLPPRLVPSRELKLSELNTGILTTYAGLLFRHFLDHFEGDVSKAIGAYNGGIRNPNMKYEEGVRLSAEYARRILEQAARLNNQAVAETRFFAPGRPRDSL